MIRILISVALLAGLAACGNAPDRSGLATLSGAALSRFRKTEPEAPDARTALTPELIARSPTSALLVVVRNTDESFITVPLASNRGTVQWNARSEQALLRRGGVLVGTRGFGFDLLTADVAGLVAAFDSGGAPDVLRVNRILTGEGVIEVRDYLCDVRVVGQETLNIYGKRHPTRVFEEDCRAGGGDFVNRFWVESDGTVRKSIERISPELGDFEVTRLTE